MGDVKDLARLIDTTEGQFDVIIDDASHASHHQQTALGYLFSHLNQGGYYIIEDLHYQPPQLEQAACIKTSDLLISLMQGIPIKTEWIEQDTLDSMKQDIEFVQFYDSCDRVKGVKLDAIAVIKKRGTDGMFARIKRKWLP